MKKVIPTIFIILAVCFFHGNPTKAEQPDGGAIHHLNTFGDCLQAGKDACDCEDFNSCNANLAKPHEGVLCVSADLVCTSQFPPHCHCVLDLEKTAIE